MSARADRASAVLAIVGVVNVPIIHYSVIWWNSLHQAPSVMKFGRPTMPASMLVPLLLMLAGFTLYFVALLLTRARGEVLRRERNARWIAEALGATATGTGAAHAEVSGDGRLRALRVAVLCAHRAGGRPEHRAGHGARCAAPSARRGGASSSAQGGRHDPAAPAAVLGARHRGRCRPRRRRWRCAPSSRT